MNLVLDRRTSGPTGVFGWLKDETGAQLFATLERAYPPLWMPKVPDGIYTCKRGPHRLAHQTYQFETFEVMGVPGRTGILFHKGNVAEESEGCILLGMRIEGDRIVESKRAFLQFLELQKNVNEFTLRIE